MCSPSKLSLTSNQFWPERSQSNLERLNTSESGKIRNFRKELEKNPSRYEKIIDYLPHKFPQDAMVFGKPNIIVNPH